MKRDFNINSQINNWIIFSEPYYRNDKEYYKIKCKCGKIEERSRRSLERPNFSKACRSCSQIERNQKHALYKEGVKISNLTILSVYHGKDLYRVQCDCGHIYCTGHPTLSKKLHDKTPLPYCSNCFSYDKKKRKGSTMLTKDISETIYNRLIREAKRKGILFDVSVEYLQNLYDKQNHKCIYTGLDIKIHFSLCLKKDRQLNTASLDRINSSRGYFEDNVQWIHKDINYMKFNLTHDNFINMCRLITSNYANIEPNQTRSCLEGAETSGSDTNLSGNTTNSVQQPWIKYEEWKFEQDWTNNHPLSNLFKIIKG